MSGPVERWRAKADEVRLPILPGSCIDLGNALAARVEELESALDTIHRWFLNPGEPGYDGATAPPFEPRPKEIARRALERR